MRFTADVLKAGAPASAYTSGPSAAANAYAATDRGGTSSCALRYRYDDSALGTFLGRDGRQHPCE